jgi:hypothetical protein
MGLENNKNSLLRSEPFPTPAGQMIPHVEDLEVGEICYVETHNILIDRSAEHGTWIYRYAKALNAGDVIELCVDAYDAEKEDEADDEDSLSTFARVIRATEGIVVDQSHEEKYDWTPLEARYNLDGGEAIELEPSKFIPVIFRAHNITELELIEDELAYGSNVQLQGTELEDVIDAAEEIIAELEQARAEADEDDENESDPNFAEPDDEL